MMSNANTCCRHSKKMIEKLENAGLGFYVRHTDTQQRLGELSNCKLHISLATLHIIYRQNSSTSAGLSSA